MTEYNENIVLTIIRLPTRCTAAHDEVLLPTILGESLLPTKYHHADESLQKVEAQYTAITKLLFLASTVAVATCATKEVRPTHLDLADVDPNTLSCDPAGLVFLLLPHFTDCNKYFMCVHGKEMEYVCPGDTIFDFVLQTCNWDWATSCTLRTPKEDSLEEEGSGDVALDLAGEEIPDSVAAIELVKPGPFGFGVVNCMNPVTASRQAAYRGDCQRFWRCIDGVAQASFCSDGLFFNPKTEQCDFEANVQCLTNVEELQDGFLVY